MVCKGHLSTCVWHKTNVQTMPLANDKLTDAFEFITVGCGSKSADCPNLGQFILGGSTACTPDLISSSGSINVFREHAVEHKLCYLTADSTVISPYQKPIRLLKRLIGIFNMKEDWILDGYAGSGSTMVAAATLGRNVLSIDIDPRSCQFMHLRINSLDSLPIEAEEIGEEPLADAMKTFKKEPMLGIQLGQHGSFHVFQRWKCPGSFGVVLAGPVCESSGHTFDDGGMSAAEGALPLGDGGALRTTIAGGLDSDVPASSMEVPASECKNITVPDSCPIDSSEA